MSVASPHVELCKTAAHLRDCGECADQIEEIVKNALQAMPSLPAPPIEEPEPERFDANGVALSGLMTSHADVPEAIDHPIEYADKCGICIQMRRRGQSRAREREMPGGPGGIIQALDQL